MANSYVNKVQKSNGEVLIDISDSTAVASDVAQGKYFYLATGEKVQGSASGGGTAAISVVDTTDSHGGTVRTITALDISDTTAVASVVQSPYWFYTADGTKTQGTGSGGTPSLTHHEIYFEFTDSTDTTIDAYYDDAFISNAITATEPTTYGQKTVDTASLDGVTWYARQAETWETIYEDSINAIQDNPYPYFWFGSSTISNVYPTVGSVWRVTFNGTVYRLTAISYYSESVGTIALIGNPKYSGGPNDGSGVPFDFFNAGWGAWSGGTESMGTYSVKLERLVTE